MVSKKVVVTNEAGLHVRPASTLVKKAETCSSEIEIVYKERNFINAKSLLNILSASIGKGEEIELRCSGPQEESDLDTMVTAIKNLE